jgi:hypothetical protein
MLRLNVITSPRYQSFTFLKLHQVQDLPNDVEVYTGSLLAMQVIPLGFDDDLLKAIQEALPTDRNIGEYFTNLCNPNLRHKDDVQEFLEPFSMQLDNLILYKGSLYIHDNDDLMP